MIAITPHLTLCSPTRSSRGLRWFSVALLPLTAVMYILRQVLMGVVLWLSPKGIKDTNIKNTTAKSKTANKISPKKITDSTPAGEMYGPLPLWQMSDIHATGDKRNPLSSGGGEGGSPLANWLKGIIAVFILVFAVACEDFVRFEAERFICDPSNGLGLQEAELVGKSNTGKMRLTFVDGDVQEVKSKVTENHYMVKTADFRAKIDRKTGAVSGKRGAYSTSFSCDVHAFKM